MITFKNHIKESTEQPDDINQRHTLKNILDQHYDPSKMSDASVYQINRYTHRSGEINNRLWEHYKNPKKELQDGAGSIKRMRRAMKEFKTPCDFTVYSSTIHDPRKHMNPEGAFHHAGFISTSINKEVAHARDINSETDENGDTHQHILKMNVEKGSDGVWAANKKLTKFQGEQEFILPDGLNMKHINTTTIKRKGYDHYNDRVINHFIHHHEMEIMK
jgi:hypothetical protein